MRPAYLRQDFESDASNGLLVFIGVILVFCSISVGTVIGYEIRDWQQRQHEAQQTPKARPVVQNPPPPLIPCTREGRIEHDRICRARFRSTQIGGLK